jgi:hemerythrin-like domain-containing protein
MAVTSQLRVQHTELLKIAGEISVQLNANELSKDASAMRALLSLLIGRLGIHLAMEDKSLYPELMKHADERVRETANRFVAEMGGIADVLEDYKRKYPGAGAIERSPEDFVKDTKMIFEALATRIDKENNELYPILEGEA